MPTDGYPGFRKPSKAEIEFLSGFKTEKLTADPVTANRSEGGGNARLHRVPTGGGFRDKPRARKINRPTVDVHPTEEEAAGIAPGVPGAVPTAP